MIRLVRLVVVMSEESSIPWRRPDVSNKYQHVNSKCMRYKHLLTIFSFDCVANGTLLLFDYKNNNNLLYIGHSHHCNKRNCKASLRLLSFMDHTH
jgi:hypothetical protein